MPRAALLVLLLLLGPARTDVISLEDRGAILQLSGDELTKRTFRFSGILKLTLLVEGGPDLEVEAPDIEVNPGEWVLVSQSKGETTTLEKGKRPPLQLYTRRQLLFYVSIFCLGVMMSFYLRQETVCMP